MTKRVILISTIIFSLVFLTYIWQSNSLFNDGISNKHFNSAGNFFNKEKSVKNSDYSEGFWTNNIFKL